MGSPLSTNMEKRPPTGDADHDDQAAAIADQTAKEQSPEEAVSSDSTNKPANTAVEESAHDHSPEQPASGNSTKNPAAVSLGRLGGLKGGKARAKTLSKRERSNAARKAAMARWRKKKPTK